MKQMRNQKLIEPRFFNRDVSWLSFNERVLMEAEKQDIPLLERLKFLAIYSSNLDEFYRVRIPSIMALTEVDSSSNELLDQIKPIIEAHQNRYGQVLADSIIPTLRKNGIAFLYNQDIPASIRNEVSNIFFTKVAGLLHFVRLGDDSKFFPENNKIYFAVVLKDTKDIFVVNIPSDHIRRFHTVTTSDQSYILMIDDIVRWHLHHMLPGSEAVGIHAIKITRDAELNLKDEVAGRITDKLEKLLAKRDYGFATRLLYDAAMPEDILKRIIKAFKLKNATKVAGGRYHNLRDFFSFPISDPRFSYAQQVPISISLGESESIYTLIDRGDVMVHTPYHNYDLILRFFNEAAIDPAVERVYVTLYRIAVDSAIAQALMSAARNGKKVTVLVELKARFDEANNIRWARKMKAAGVRICYSSPAMKVHAKIALVKRRIGPKKAAYYGLFSTGNFNETTARLYTDHILLTSRKRMLQEVLELFKFLAKGVGLPANKHINFTDLIVAPFNIRERFFGLIDREIANAREGKQAVISIKLNNLEEETLISKLYEASSAGVTVNLIVRSICRLIPGEKGLSENISVNRIVDRYLEHGRIFVFHNGGEEEVFCGSADWMNRNIYHRIEVCFPIQDDRIKEELKTVIAFQRNDTEQGTAIRPLPQGTRMEVENVPLTAGRQGKNIGKGRSQDRIYEMIKNRSN